MIKDHCHAWSVYPSKHTCSEFAKMSHILVMFIGSQVLCRLTDASNFQVKKWKISFKKCPVLKYVYLFCIYNFVYKSMSAIFVYSYSNYASTDSGPEHDTLPNATGIHAWSWWLWRFGRQIARTRLHQDPGRLFLLLPRLPRHVYDGVLPQILPK